MRIKRAVRFLAGSRRLVWEYREFGGEERPVQLEVFVDWDWAGSTDRKSTGGEIVLSLIHI